MSKSPPKPIFGLEIEIFVKVKPEVKSDVLGYRYDGLAGQLPAYWQAWDFDLVNDKPTSRNGYGPRQAQQRQCVKMALAALIKDALGAKSGWKCVGDASLQEWQLKQAPDAEHWWGVEIISPPMSVARRWQSEIREVFDAIGEQFDLWTHPVTSCHVHVSPGPTLKTKYTTSQLVRIAKGAFYWEKALKKVLPHDRRKNDYAKPNHKAFATKEYKEVKEKTYGPVFWAIDNEMNRFETHRQGQIKCFCIKIAGGHLRHPNHKYRKERYLSMNFLPVIRLGTTELRRQGGVASAQSAIHRVLLAVTLHCSARRYDFKGHASRRDHPSFDELKAELHGCIKNLPRTCHGTRFVKWLNDSAEAHGGERPLSERQINSRELSLHDTSGASIRSQPSRSSTIPVVPPPPRAEYVRAPPGPVSYGTPTGQTYVASDGRVYNVVETRPGGSGYR